MSKVIDKVKNLWHFVSVKIWKIRLDKVNKRQGVLLRQLRILFLSIQGFYEDKCFTKATALTFYTIFSIVPVLALVFAISKGFGFEKNLQEQLLINYPEYTQLLNKAFVYAGSMLQNTQSGLIAGFGIVLLLWSVIKLLDSVEEIFNEIWEIKKGRTLLRKLTDYITVMIISPVLMILAGGIILSIENHIGNIHLLSVLNIILIKLFAYCLIMAVFTCLYLVMPNTKVNLKSAAIAGLIASIMFQILEWAYVKFQIGANSLNVIYGGFAALPLFLILIQYSWYVVLFGAEIAFANEHVDQYELKNEINKLSSRYKKIISLMIANVVSKRFYNGEKPLSDIEISEQLDIPYRLARMIINDFTETGIFNEIKSENTKEIRYQPGVTESKFTVNYIIETIDKKGTNTLPISDTNELIHINKLVEDMDKIFHNNLGNTLVHELVK